jgi:hypothetical protein
MASFKAFVCIHLQAHTQNRPQIDSSRKMAGRPKIASPFPQGFPPCHRIAADGEWSPCPESGRILRAASGLRRDRRGRDLPLGAGAKAAEPTDDWPTMRANCLPVRRRWDGSDSLIRWRAFDASQHRRYLIAVDCAAAGAAIDVTRHSDRSGIDLRESSGAVGSAVNVVGERRICGCRRTGDPVEPYGVLRASRECEQRDGEERGCGESFHGLPSFSGGMPAMDPMRPFADDPY